MEAKRQLPIFSLHAAVQGDEFDKFLNKFAFDDCRYLKKDSRNFDLIVFTLGGVYQGLVSCRNDDMRNYCLKRGKERIAGE